ncbi:MAG: hypothetical protein NXI22_10580 [bacterium]|nr:hypothetical protein [bacterium]
MVRLFSIFTLAAFIALFGCMGDAAAQRPGKSQDNIAPMPVTPEREAAALTFVQLHHPELTELLKGLKKQNLGEYQRAMRELYRTSERLSMFLQRDPIRYKAELELWKTSSRIHLIAAQLKTTASESQRDEFADTLRQLLAEQADKRLTLLRQERKRTQLKLDRVNDQIEKFEAGRRDSLESQFNHLTKKRTPGKSKTKATSKSDN